MFYVYQYRDPRDGLPFYIGKGIDQRAYTHLYETKETTTNLRKYYKIQSILKDGFNPIIEILSYFEDDTAAYEFEETLISQYGRKGYEQDGILTNITLGSRPPSQKGRKWSEDQKIRHRTRMKEAMKTIVQKGRRPWNKGKKGLQTAWNRGMIGTTGHRHTESTKEKLRQASTGKKKSIEARRKMSENMKGRVPWNKGAKLGVQTHNATPCIFISPSGDRFTFPSMRQGCLHLGLPPNKMCDVKNGHLDHYKGWKVILNNPAKEEMI